MGAFAQAEQPNSFEWVSVPNPFHKIHLRGSYMKLHGTMLLSTPENILFFLMCRGATKNLIASPRVF